MIGNAGIVGSGSGTPVLFANGLGTTGAIWAAYIARWQAERRLVRLELPGHGAAPSPTRPIGIGDLAEEAIGLLDAEGIEQVHVVGVSMGGMIAQWLGARHPERVASLTVASAGVRTGTAAFWEERAASVRASGLGELAAAMPERWFSPAFLAEQPAAVEAVVTGLRACDPVGYAACCEAIGSFDGADLVGEITAPTLVVGGDADPVSGPEVTKDLAERIRGARYALVAGASHLLTLERPDEVAELVDELMALAG